jgi:type IV secretion system protein VirB1
MQINSFNLPALNMTIRLALDSCASLKGGASVLSAAYGGGHTSAEQQAALLMALSRYNTGSPFLGIMNGYARKVMMNSDGGAIPALSAAIAATPISDPNAPPLWNVSAIGTYAQQHGASWLIALAPIQDNGRRRAGPPGATPSPIVALN